MSQPELNKIRTFQNPITTELNLEIIKITCLQCNLSSNSFSTTPIVDVVVKADKRVTEGVVVVNYGSISSYSPFSSTPFGNHVIDQIQGRLHKTFFGTGRRHRWCWNNSDQFVVDVVELSCWGWCGTEFEVKLTTKWHTKIKKLRKISIFWTIFFGIHTISKLKFKTKYFHNK